MITGNLRIGRLVKKEVGRKYLRKRNGRGNGADQEWIRRRKLINCN